MCAVLAQVSKAARTRQRRLRCDGVPATAIMQNKLSFSFYFSCLKCPVLLPDAKFSDQDLQAGEVSTLARPATVARLAPVLVARLTLVNM